MRLTHSIRATASTAMLAFLAVPAPARAETAAEAEVRAVYVDGIAAFNRHDLAAFLRGFGDDVEMYTPVGWLRGKAAIRQRFVETFAGYPSTRMEIEDLKTRQVAPDTVIVDFRWRTFPRGQGPAFHGLASGVYVRRAGRWVEVLEHETISRIDPGAAVPPARRPAPAPR